MSITAVRVDIPLSEGRHRRSDGKSDGVFDSTVGRAETLPNEAA